MPEVALLPVAAQATILEPIDKLATLTPAGISTGKTIAKIAAFTIKFIFFIPEPFLYFESIFSFLSIAFAIIKNAQRIGVLIGRLIFTTA